ncbi:cysteine hydrolase family protein [Chitinophaga vietnamensis]|uniref:cysteine hydrolase family protein n=1 Tax=Chitinophaga vietnamensis TaxID=2593957 RepID=UPI001177FB04|nr:cysteine hydrolase family protein [Chitinophaga vietnamensis]
MKQALIIVDVQNDYFKGGLMELSGAETVADNIGRILEHCRLQGMLVVHVQHIDNSSHPAFFFPNTEGARINNRVLPAAGEKVITKHTPNSFQHTDLLPYLRNNNITDLLITGMMTHVCIDATTKAAKDFGFNCTVIGDACATRDVEVLGNKVKAVDVQNAMLAALSFYYATIRTTSEMMQL